GGRRSDQRRNAEALRRTGDHRGRHPGDQRRVRVELRRMTGLWGRPSAPQPPTRAMTTTSQPVEAEPERAQPAPPRPLTGAPVLAALILPALLVYGLFVIYPIVQSLRFSVYNWNGLGPLVNWVGLGNFVEAFNSAEFRAAVLHCFIIAVLSLALQLPFALSLA